MTLEKFVIETERTVLRPLTAEDAQSLADAVFTDPEVAKTLVGDWSDPSRRVDEAKRWIEAAQNWEVDGYGIWGVYDSFGLSGTRGALVGLCAADEPLADVGRGPEIYYALCRNVWGRRLATEVVTTVVRYLIESAKVPVVEALYYPEINEASLKIAKRLGFEFVGRYPIMAYLEDRARETIEYDFWRIRNYDGQQPNDTLADTAFKLGLFVGEGAMPKEEAIQRLLEAAKEGGFANSLDLDKIEDLIANRLSAGAAENGYLHYRLVRR